MTSALLIIEKDDKLINRNKERDIIYNQVDYS
jgi:hypothetical protein